MMKNKKNTSSILEFNGGAILERIDLELSKVLKNIADLNTDPVKPRKIKVELTVQADYERKNPAVTVKVSSSLQPTNPIKVSLLTVQIVDEETGEIKEGLQENCGVAPGQINLSGDVVMPEIYIPSEREN